MFIVLRPIIARLRRREQALWGALAAWREKEGGLIATTSLEFECEMLIGGDDIRNDIITLGACFHAFFSSVCLIPSSETQGQIVGAEGKSKRAGQYGTQKSKERREEPLGTMSYQTSSKRSPSFWLLYSDSCIETGGCLPLAFKLRLLNKNTLKSCNRIVIIS